jgi:hypothetical protein
MTSLIGIPLCSYAKEPVPRRGRIDAGQVSFSIVDRPDGTHWWRRSNKEFRIEIVQLEPAGDLLHYLFLTELVTETHIGIEGPNNARMKVTAYPLTERNVEKAAWSFEVDGDEWSLDGDRIKVMKYGCCDDPGRTFYFRVKDGRPID